MTVLIIYITFLFLLAILIMVAAYFIATLIARRLHPLLLRQKINRVRRVWEYHMEYPEPEWIPAYELKRMRRLVLNRLGLEAFDACYRRHAAEHGYTKTLSDYASLVIHYPTLLHSFIVRDHYRASYILHLLSEYYIHISETDYFALQSLNSRSLYVRYNALKVIKNTASPGLMIAALKTVSNSTQYYNDKILIDFLDTFTGDHQDLSDFLIYNHHCFSSRVCCMIAGYFKNHQFDSPAIRSLMLEGLNGEDKEQIIAAAKYFGWVTDRRAEKTILAHLDHPDWEIRALCARVCQRGYGSREMIAALERRIKDTNWYVRLNSAFALIAMDDHEDRIMRMLNEEDRYAREAAIYVMFVKKKIDYEKYQELMEEIQSVAALS